MKNINKQGIKRPWKTPSPSIQDNLKSPRFGRTFQNRNGVALKTSKQSENKQEFGKHRNLIKHFRSQLVHLKEEANKMIISEEKKKGSQISIKNNRYLLKTENTQNDPSMTPFNSYYHGTSKQEMTQRQPEYEDDKMVYPNSYRQCLRKCAAENAKLKKELKEVLTREKVLLSEKQEWRQKQKLKNDKAKSFFENQLFDQVSELKKQLEKCQQQLNKSNLQIYEIKQDIYEAQIQKQKLQKKLQQKINEIQLNKNAKIQCKTCGKLQTQTDELIKQVDNKIYELCQKQGIISGLCSEIKSLELEIKGYEKPKQYQKKLLNLIHELNQQLMKEKMGKLNSKYRIQN